MITFTSLRVSDRFWIEWLRGEGVATRSGLLRRHAGFGVLPGQAEGHLQSAVGNSVIGKGVGGFVVLVTVVF